MRNLSDLISVPKNNALVGIDGRPISNGLGEALFSGGGFPGHQIGVQLSQADTLFKNNRWYFVSNLRQLLCEIYVEHGLIQNFIDVPVDDALRGGIDIKTKELDPDDIQNLITLMRRERDLRIMGQGLKWNRLFGGGGVIIVTDQDPATPLDISKIKEGTPFMFRACDMWELYWSQQNTDDYSVAIDDQGLDVEYYDYYGIKLHRSRVMKLKGLEAPSFLRPRLRGWGFSVLEGIVRSVNQYLKQNDLTFEVLDEFKLDIFKIKNLTNTLMTPDGTAAVARRIQMANRQKNYQNALTMDSEDDYIQKQLSFSGLAEVMNQIRIQIAADLRMPLSKIFGIGATGFSSGEDDIENYNSMVESTVREKAEFDILKMVEIRCQMLYGFIPDDLSIEFKPLRILSSEQQENVRTHKFNRTLQARQAGEITTEEFRDACNKENLLPIQLDPDVPLELEQEKEAKEDADSAAAPAGKASKLKSKEAKV